MFDQSKKIVWNEEVKGERDRDKKWKIESKGFTILSGCRPRLTFVWKRNTQVNYSTWSIVLLSIHIHSILFFFFKKKKTGASVSIFVFISLMFSPFSSAGMYFFSLFHRFKKRNISYLLMRLNISFQYFQYIGESLFFFFRLLLFHRSNEGMFGTTRYCALCVCVLSRKPTNKRCDDTLPSSLRATKSGDVESFLISC